MAAPDLDSLTQQYARAAYQYTAEGWLEDLRKVWDRLSATPGSLDALNDAGTAFAERQARLDDALPPDLRGDVKNFLYVLLRDGHLELLDGVIGDLTRFAAHGPSAQAARIISAVPLTAEERSTFQTRIQPASGERVDIEFRVDPAILGGVILQVGDKVIDGSIAGKLSALHSRLVAAR